MWEFNFHFKKQENCDIKQVLEFLNSTELSQKVCESRQLQSTDHKRISSGPNPFHRC